MAASEADRLQREVAFQDLLATLGWSSLRHVDRASFERDIRAIEIPDEAVLAQIARDRKPIMLAPLHMGAFALPFARIMRDYFADRPMLILRAREDRPEETTVMRRISELGIDMRFLNIANKQNYLDAVRFARTGAVIVSFCDLPATYGSPEPVQMFGQRCELAMGIASLARVTEATVVPIAVYSSINGDRVRIGQPFECYRTGADERARVASLIARHIETSVLVEPEQWHMWPRFHEFLARVADQSPIAREGLAA
jgi:KDO2-lipid IV(A) lauroyltransferase